MTRRDKKMLPKLVRNHIPNIIAEKKTRIAHYYTANDVEYWDMLKEKLVEEVQEFLNSDNNIEEIADILEVIDAIIAFKNKSHAEINAIKSKKAQSHGTFSEKIILSSIEEI
jgi:predicted house-cleaning noncanonical NTP pyrophosphatase (MazG superfamily)